jgi:hypothetical protein
MGMKVNTYYNIELKNITVKRKKSATTSLKSQFIQNVQNRTKDIENRFVVAESRGKKKNKELKE